MGDDDFKTEESSAGIHFFPPLYTQRYVLALNTLEEHNIQSVVDFGCSECGFLKLLPTAACVRKAALVDIDRSLLLTRRKHIHPQLHHYIQRRLNPLHVFLFCGSAEHMDKRIQGYEAATLIEVIEHLHPDTLARVTENVFGHLKPRLCFVTTPNSEFNVLFKNPDPSQFRHWDHKFEWTRSEFSSWCEYVGCRFNYNVKYTGVGEMTSDPESARLGPCSQGAVFTLRLPTARPSSSGDVAVHQPSQARDACVEYQECYELIEEAEYPYVKTKVSKEEKLDMEVSFCLRELIRGEDRDIAYGEKLPISVERLAGYRSVTALADLEGVRKSLERQLYALTPDRNHVLIGAQDSSSEEDLQGGESDEEKEKSSPANSQSLDAEDSLNLGDKNTHTPAEEEENWDDAS
ncbi:hypothetical protein EGW08_011811 [Elysia chlorotica]|uniref:Small RNA 2'-O-methyltransferase n=1 Tax=Elysia chlorotica TaxID=188477 RepID=A0A433TFU8_ELYCH|nr:hypothetical protein EGW08_011811 [Elysia chlorotica]